MSDFQPCLFCGGDASALDHLSHCDGRQGGRDVESARINRHRDTSAVAFYNAVNTGTVKTLQQQVWHALRVLGPSTMMEMHRYFRSRGIVSDSHSVSPRFAELRDLGFIREAGERPCLITGQSSIVWAAIPLEDYRPLSIVRHRCDACGQLLSREVKKAS